MPLDQSRRVARRRSQRGKDSQGCLGAVDGYGIQKQGNRETANRRGASLGSGTCFFGRQGESRGNQETAQRIERLLLREYPQVSGRQERSAGS